MILEECKYFDENITTSNLKNIYENTTPGHYKLFQYRNQSKTNKYTNKFKDFVLHCLKEMVGI